MTRAAGPDVGGLTPLFRPRGIAVVGASRSPGKLGAALARSLTGFADAGGYLALVNPRDASMHTSLDQAAADGPLDLVMICVPAVACPGVLAAAGAAGARAAVVCGGGFAEAGAEGAEHQHQLATIAAETGIRLLGPNTSGFLNPRVGLAASFVPGVGQIMPGPVAVVAASGGVNHALAFMLAEAGHGISLGVGLGNAVDVSTPDVLDYLASDTATRAVALHLESVDDGPRLVDAVHGLTLSRPVVALVVGRHDVGAFAASHTGALATSWRTTRAALAQAGAVLVDNERELVDAVGALAGARAPARTNPGVGVVTAQAGPGLLLLDSLKARRVAVPEFSTQTQDRLAQLLPPLTYQRNPVDTGRPTEELSAILAAVAADTAVDVVAAYALHEPDAVDLVAAVTAGRHTDVPIVLGLGGTGPDVRRDRTALLEAGIAVVSDPTGVATAVTALIADARAQADRDLQLADRGPTITGITDAHDEDRAKTLLGRLGITTPPRRVCADRVAAHAALHDLGGPVAVKILDAAILHKSDVGGVHLGIASAGDLDSALDKLDVIGAGRYLVEAMAPAGVDLIVGARRDPVFGPMVLVGLGGTLAEATADVSVRLAPVVPPEAAKMVAELVGRDVLFGWRGGPVLDCDDLGRIVASLGSLLTRNPALDEIEINPLRLTTNGLVALDAVVITKETHDAQPHL